MKRKRKGDLEFVVGGVFDTILVFIVAMGIIFLGLMVKIHDIFSQNCSNGQNS